MNSDSMTTTAAVVYGGGYLATFVYMIAADVEAGVRWWGWPIALAADTFLATIWPIYWTTLHWLT